MVAHAVAAGASAYAAPAKLNLMLKIVGRRDDGYHLLETVFRFVDLNDTVYLKVRDDGQIVLHTLIEGVAPEQDLSVRAARLLQQKSASRLGADIWVDKKIPMGGGLGGGSSDAATVLLALNHLWKVHFSRPELIQLGVGLGADVPVFLYGRNSFATGVGEELTPVSLEKQWYVIVRPNVHVETAKIFAHEGLTRNSIPSIMRTLTTTQQRHNDMQDVVVSEYPQVAEALDALTKFGQPLMTGSGSCVFLEIESEGEARQVYQALSEQQYEVYCVQGLSEHPLLSLG
ncbi:4-(cytidine 5'-diphospho)-2-C-methyl-D-erythritol kinase [Neisseriaceae bacterium CLB008]|nr:4-(cytidine 5'-diphospho)-2-C-methyl-D-erythritol kinase [Neisseriaceae bacterium]